LGRGDQIVGLAGDVAFEAVDRLGAGFVFGDAAVEVVVGGNEQSGGIVGSDTTAGQQRRNVAGDDGGDLLLVGRGSRR
jgi:hypothetical protein